MGGAPGYPAYAPCWGSAVQAQAAGRSRIRGGGGLLDVGSDSTRSLPSAERLGRGHDRHPLGWQPSRFLADRAEAERAFQLAEQLGRVNAAAAELGTTWPSLRKAFGRHGLGMPARNPEAVRQRAIAAAHQRNRAAGRPGPGPGVRGPQPRRPPGPRAITGRAVPVGRRDEEYAILGANVVVELNSESRARQPTSRAWAIIRRADRNRQRAGQRTRRPDRRQAERASRPDRPHQPHERGIVADAR